MTTTKTKRTPIEVGQTRIMTTTEFGLGTEFTIVSIDLDAPLSRFAHKSPMGRVEIRFPCGSTWAYTPNQIKRISRIK